MLLTATYSIFAVVAGSATAFTLRVIAPLIVWLADGVSILITGSAFATMNCTVCSVTSPAESSAAIEIV